MVEKFKELRLYFCLGVIVAEFFPWLEMVSKSETTGPIEASAQANNVITGFAAFKYSYIGILLMLIPIALIAMVFISQINIKKSTMYMVGSVLGVALSVVTILIYKSSAVKASSAANTVGSVADVEVEVVANIKIGFWIALACFVAIFVTTLIKDFALNKETISQKGIKGALKGVVDDVSLEISQKVETIAAEGPKLTAPEFNTCPQCNEKVAKGKKFCAKCGAKMPESEEGGLNIKLPGKGAKTTKMLTVSDYIKNMKTIICDNCKSPIQNGTKFCPNCGEKVVLKVVLDKCIACGGEILKDKNYCPDCGNKIEAIELKTNCSKCNGELLYNKKYCVECGEKVE